MICLFHCQQDLGCARRGVKNKSMILVVSPLKALMMDQVSVIQRLVLSTVCVTDKSVPQILKSLKGCKKENIKL